MELGANGDGESQIIETYITRRKCSQNTKECEKKKHRDSVRKVSLILRKCETLRTADENRLLESCSEMVKEVYERRERVQRIKERIIEREDPPELIEKKARKLADVISRARHLICYTGAGISTSARIPDYRGSQGIWTLLQKGENIGAYDLSLAEPTFTHMALFELHRRKMLRFVVSQNCDGLHLRSGLPRDTLSEVHGNMYIEACKFCKPNREYWRLFDTTEQTARYQHKTNRRCHSCGTALADTIVHFGERGSLKWPLNWAGACAHSEKTDVILCLGSSLKVLKKYSWLWAMDRPAKKRPKLYIVNLQWTPKDDVAALKINGKCDDVMAIVMKQLKIRVPDYDRNKDPIFAHATVLLPEELHTVSQPILKADLNEVECDEVVSSKVETVLDLRIRSNEEETPSSNVPVKRAFDDLDVEDQLNEIINACSSEDEEADRRQCIEKQLLTEIKSEETPLAVWEDSGVCMEPDAFPQTVSVAPVDNAEVATQTSPSLFDEEASGDDEDDQSAPLDLKLNGAPVPRRTIESPTKAVISAATVNAEPFAAQSMFGQFLTVSDTNHGDQMMCNALKIAETLQRIAQSRAQVGLPEHQELLMDSFSQEFLKAVQCPEKYYETLLRYCRALDGTLPNWYDVNYAYSGLHSIIRPPPPEIDLWGTIIIPICQMKSQTTSAECDFCFDNYGECVCQFYKPAKPEFQVTIQRNGKLIVCECCDVGEEKPVSVTTCIDGGDNDDKKDESKEPTRVNAGWYGKGYRKNRKRKKL